MSDFMSSTDVADAERFERIDVAADAEGAALTRDDFAGWLQRYFQLDLIRSSDVVLAINEALANAAEFAYLPADRPGTVDVHAEYNSDDAKLTVTISDRGVWRMPEPTPETRFRGRGIPLMRALSDRTAIETSRDGTNVCLEWRGVTRG